MKKILLITLLLSTLYSQQNSFEYTTPNNFDFITNTPDDFVELYERATQKENLWIWGIIASSSVVLWYYDEELIAATQKLGKRLGIKGKDAEPEKVLLSVGPYPLFKIPTDSGSALYFLGDGTVHVGIMAGFVGYGYFANDTKALNVGSQLAEGLLDVMVATQVLKHITGRQTYNKKTAPRGKWDFFPNQTAYAKSVPTYDAFPSGHLATAMMTTTILHENYPTNKWILPVGYTLMGVLSIQMLNNGVHWASDYPLAIGIGYSFGRIIAQRQRGLHKEKLGWSVIPKIYENGYGLALNYKY